LISSAPGRNHFICGDKRLHSETQRRRGLFAEARIQVEIASFVVKAIRGVRRRFPKVLSGLRLALCLTAESTA
jgi:hypothetical protein